MCIFVEEKMKREKIFSFIDGEVIFWTKRYLFIYFIYLSSMKLKALLLFLQGTATRVRSQPVQSYPQTLTFLL